MKRIQFIYLFILFASYLSAQDGSPDLSFADNGILREDQNLSLSTIALQKDGKMIYVGMFPNFQSNIIVMVRYNEDGTLDNSFGTNGRVEKEISSYSTLSDVIVLNNGDIMLSGSMFQAAFLAKIDTDGNFKTDFGGDGIIEDLDIDSDFQAAYMHLTEDEEIYLLHGYTQNGSAAPAISKWTTDGERILDFGTNGEVQFDISFGKEPTALETDDNDNVYAMYRDGSIIKMDANGNLDTNFGTDGYILTGPGSGNQATFSGLKSHEDQLFIYGYGLNTYHVWKINDLGESLTDFGDDGILSGQWDSTLSSAKGIYILEDNSLLIGGEIRVDNMNIDLCLVKYNEEGELDNSFADNGILRTDLEGAVRARLYSSNKPGTILIAGRQNIWPEPESYITAFRYHFDQTLESKALIDSPISISLYPNPSSDQVKLNFPDRRLKNYEIVDLQGKIIKTALDIDASNSLNIRIDQLAAGKYLLNLVFYDGFSSTHQLLKLD